IELDLEADLLRVGDDALELLNGAEPRVDRVVAAFFGADRPRAAGIAALRSQRVVPPFAVRLADGMDRREVHDVEAELLELRQHRPHAGEAAPRAREELVPRAEARELAVDVDRVRRGDGLLGTVARRRRQRVVERHALPLE